MKLEHHDLDVYPVPKEKKPLYVNEPWLIDDSNYEFSWGKREPENEDDNIRIYVADCQPKRPPVPYLAASL